MAFAGTTRFSLLAKLGEGGMGIVYEAYDHSRDMRVALKTLRRVGPAHLYHFKREFRALSDLSHPNIITLYELLSEAGHWFLTMELVEGPDLLVYVRKGLPGPVPSAMSTSMDDLETRTSASPSWSQGAEAQGAEASAAEDREANDSAAPVDSAGPARPLNRPDVELMVDMARLRDGMAQLARALDALHSAGMVHRDLKPSNVRVTADDRVVLMDFGVVAEVDRPQASPLAGSAVGTPLYMAPEQVDGTEATAAADWYAFGVLLYKALTGRLPHEGSAQQVMRAKKERDPQPPSTFVTGIPAELERLCMALLTRDPGERPAGAEVLQALGAGPTFGPRGSEAAVEATAEAASGERARAGVPVGDFVGRAAQLAALDHAYAAVRARGTACVLVKGPSGMGKTRLVEHFLGQLQVADPAEAPLVLTGRCHQRETLAYKAFDGVIDMLCDRLAGLPEDQRQAIAPAHVAALSRLFPMLLEVVSQDDLAAFEGREPAEVRAQALEALRALFIEVAQARPTVICIEDLQWADRDSFEMLSCLLRPPAPPGLLLVATLRSEALEAADSAELVEFIAALEARGLHREVTVGPLSEDEQRELLAKLSRRRRIQHLAQLHEDIEDRLRHESAGHPMLLAELVRYLHDEIEAPEAGSTFGLEDVIWRRVNRLSAPARALLEVMAVAGEPLPLRVLAAAANIAGTERERAAARVCVAQLARVSKSQHDEPWLDCFHDKVRVAIRGRLAGEHARFLHVQLAHALESWADAPVTSMAHHWLAAGDRRQAALYLLQAGQSAAHQLAFDRATQLYRAGLKLLPEDDTGVPRLERARCRAWIGLAESMRAADRDPDALELLQRAEAVATEHRLVEELATLHYVRGSLLFPRGDYQGCLAEQEKAYAYALKARSTKSEAHALSGLGDAHYMRGRMITAKEYFDRCIELCDDHGLSGIKAANLSMRGLSRYYQNDFEAALRDGLEGAGLAARIGHQRAEIVARSCLGWVLMEMGRLDESRHEYERALGMVRAVGARRFEPFSMTGLAKILALENRITESRDMARQSVAVCRDTGAAFVGPMALAVLALVTDDTGERQVALDEGQDILRGGTVSHNYLHFYRDAMETSLVTGQLDQVERYAAALERYTEPEPLPWSDFFIARARLLARHARDPEALERPSERDELIRLLEVGRGVGLHVASRALAQVLDPAVPPTSPGAASL